MQPARTCTSARSSSHAFSPSLLPLLHCSTAALIPLLVVLCLLRKPQHHRRLSFLLAFTPSSLFALILCFLASSPPPRKQVSALCCPVERFSLPCLSVTSFTSTIPARRPCNKQSPD